MRGGHNDADDDCGERETCKAICQTGNLHERRSPRLRKSLMRFFAANAAKTLARAIRRAHSDGASKRARPLLFIVRRSLAIPPTIWQLPLTKIAPLGAATYP